MAAVRENRFFWCFTACSPAAALCILFSHEGPRVEWLTQAFALAVWGGYPEEVVWNHDGKRRRLWPGVCWYTSCFFTPVSCPEEPPQTLQGVLCAMSVSLLALSALAQQCPALSTEVWLPAGHESCLTSPFLRRICWCTSSHASQYWETFQKQHLYGAGGVERERGGRVV